jgi:hypothetical protein
MSFAGDFEEAIEDAFENADHWQGAFGEVQDEWDDNLEHDLVVNDEEVRVKILEISTGTYDDDTYMIFQVTQPDGTVRHVRKFGWTASHDGTYWEGSVDEVESYEKVETYWRTKR